MAAWASENPHNRVYDLVASVRAERGDLSHHQLLVGSEELARPGVAVRVERARTEARRRQVNRSRVAVRIAGDLAEDPVAATSVGQNDSRAQPGLGQVREWEGNEHYRAR
jgi:hypothetical protein